MSDELDIRVAATLMLIYREGHPIYPSTATWHGGVGGQAITLGCNFKDPSPDGYWAAEIERPLRDWIYEHPDVDLNKLADELKNEWMAPYREPRD